MLTLIRLFSTCDCRLFDLSHGSLMTSTFQGPESPCLLDVKEIISVVGMVPHSVQLPSCVVEDRFFVVEKSGLEIARSGPEEDEGEGEGEDN